MSVCLIEAYEARHRIKNPISQHEYIWSILEHLKGVKHPEDVSKTVEDTLGVVEPWVASLRSWCLSASFEPVEDTSSHERLFISCYEDNVEDFKAIFETSNTLAPVLQAAACLAAQTKSCSILDYCLSHNASFDSHLDQACILGATAPELLEVLFAHNWRNIKDKPQVKVFAFGEESFIGEWLKEKMRLMKEEKKPGNLRQNENGKGRGGKQGGATSQGRDPSKGTGSRDPRAGPDPNKIQEWFGDVPW